MIQKERVGFQFEFHSLPPVYESLSSTLSPVTHRIYSQARALKGRTLDTHLASEDLTFLSGVNF